jgi:hypothetical protein
MMILFSPLSSDEPFPRFLQKQKASHFGWEDIKISLFHSGIHD